MAYSDRINDQNRMVNIVRRSSLQELFPSGNPWQNAAVMCGTAYQRGVVFYHILYRAVCAQMPVIVLYSTENTAQQLRQHQGTRFLGPDRPLYMPLLGMRASEALTAICPSGASRDWASTEWQALEFYLNLLERLGLPMSLRHLLWLTRLNRSSFSAYIRSAPGLSELERRDILDRTAAYYGGTQPIILLVCDRLERLQIAATQEQLLDLRRNDPGCDSILTAIRSQAVLGIRLDSAAASRSGMDLLCNELRIARNGRIPFLLACCDMIIPENCALAEQLQSAGDVMTSFLSMDHAPNAFPSQRDDFWKGMLKGSLLVLNCGNPGIAAAYEELFGSFQRIKVTRTRTRSHSMLSLISTYGSAKINSEETVPRIRQQALCGNPQGGVFSPEGSNVLQIIGDLGL